MAASYTPAESLRSHDYDTHPYNQDNSISLYHKNYVQRKRYADDDEAIRHCCNQYLKLYLGWLMQPVQRQTTENNERHSL